MGATLGWARFLLASTSEEGIESSDGDIEVVGTSGEVETVDGIDEGVEASGEAEAMDVSVEGAQVSVAEGEELVVVKDCHLEPNLMLVALQERQEASRLPEEFISEVADAVIKVQHSSVVAKKDNNPESLICRPNFGFITRPQQLTPKKRHPKNKRAMGINLGHPTTLLTSLTFSARLVSDTVRGCYYLLDSYSVIFNREGLYNERTCPLLSLSVKPRSTLWLLFVRSAQRREIARVN